MSREDTFALANRLVEACSGFQVRDFDSSKGTEKAASVIGLARELRDQLRSDSDISKWTPEERYESALAAGLSDHEARESGWPTPSTPQRVEPSEDKIRTVATWLLRNVTGVVDRAGATEIAKDLLTECGLAPVASDGEPGLSFAELRAANCLRLPQFKNRKGEIAHSRPNGSDWSPAQWLQAVVGELGEYANIRKKFERGDIDEPEFLREAADELADVQTYLDILAFRLGIDLGAATASKFNRVSERVGADVRIPFSLPRLNISSAPGDHWSAVEGGDHDDEFHEVPTHWMPMLPDPALILPASTGDSE